LTVTRRYDATTTNLLYLLPVGCIVIIPSTLLFNYFLAAGLGHSRWDFPYISDTGDHVPESSVFSFMLTIGNHR
jgi:hypothetical protein